jgi:hypothetical protein
MNKITTLTIFAILLVIVSCQKKVQNKEMGTYQYDLQFFENEKIETIELVGKDMNARILVVPAYQGRVMTSTADGLGGNSYGWINYSFISSKKVEPAFNPVGGEERFWIGPEGGAFSFYFDKDKDQDFKNWRVPSFIDTEPFYVTEKNKSKVKFAKKALLPNASETSFEMQIERTVSMLSTTDVSDLLNLTIDASLKMVAFRTENSLKNAGQTAWTETTGMPSIWMLCMFNSTPTTTVFIPYRQDGVGNVVKDDYFGKVPADRLKLDNKMLYFKIDGKMRTKIGVSQSRAKNIVGSYDTEKNVLTLLWFNLPTGKRNYVNSQWGKQNDPFTGDVINSYNDGPLEDGSIMGPFYEIETSSPAARLQPNESIKHIQCMIHLQGDKSELAKIVQELFGVKLETITTIF